MPQAFWNFFGEKSSAHGETDNLPADKANKIVTESQVVDNIPAPFATGAGSHATAQTNACTPDREFHYLRNARS